MKWVSLVAGIFLMLFFVIRTIRRKIVYQWVVNALLAEHYLSFVELAPENPFAAELSNKVIDNLRRGFIGSSSDAELIEHFNSSPRMQQLNLLANALDGLGRTPRTDAEGWRDVQKPFLDLGKHTDLLPWAVKQLFRSTGERFAIADGAFKIEDWGLSDQAECQGEKRQRIADEAMTSFPPTLAEVEDVGDELRAKLISVFITLDECWADIWVPGARGTTPSNQSEERQIHLLASLVTLGEVAVLASGAATKLPPVSAWNQSGLATDIIQLIRYAADKSSESDEILQRGIVAAARLDPERLEARVRDCYGCVQTYSSSRSSVADEVLLEGLFDYLVRPLAGADLAERCYGDREVKIQVTRNLIQKSWASIVSRLRQLRGR